MGELGAIISLLREGRKEGRKGRKERLVATVGQVEGVKKTEQVSQCIMVCHCISDTYSLSLPRFVSLLSHFTATRIYCSRLPLVSFSLLLVLKEMGRRRSTRRRPANYSS